MRDTSADLHIINAIVQRLSEETGLGVDPRGKTVVEKVIRNGTYSPVHRSGTSLIDNVLLRRLLYAS